MIDDATIIELRKDDKTGVIEYYVHYDECTSLLKSLKPPVRFFGPTPNFRSLSLYYCLLLHC